ncbi:peroxiredoxin-5, mitochondrial [Microplitis mediator]|uniref:peroxiredoxin-5, mitochondrial n=1 Tax=Microplitis mediator TaxID=375433 RepID=UPI0025548B85|nr:peroxiredoxin-5, mitochondrial [Microplitis mediator]
MTLYISRAITAAGRSSLSCLKRSFHLSPKTMVISVGDKIPSVDLYEDAPSNKVNAAELSSGKKVIIFGVPGAFTPGCSKTHLPGYIAKAGELKSKGIDEIVCVSVNDPFVMSAWGKDQGAEGKVRMLADTNAEFTKAIDVAMDLAVLGGTRSKRYSLVVDNGIVKEVNIEPDNTGLSCSLADHIKV